MPRATDTRAEELFARLAPPPASPMTFKGASDRIFALTRRNEDPWLQGVWSVLGVILTLIAWALLVVGLLVKWTLMRFGLFRGAHNQREKSRKASLEELRHRELIEELREVRKALAAANEDLQQTTEMARITRTGAEAAQPRRILSRRDRAGRGRTSSVR